MAYYALSMLVIAIELARGERRLPGHGDQVPRAVRARSRGRSSSRVSTTPEDGFFYDRLVYPSGESTQVKVQTISGLIPLLPAVDLPPRAVEPPTRSASGSRACARAGRTAGGSIGRPRAASSATSGSRAALGDRPRRTSGRRSRSSSTRRRSSRRTACARCRSATRTTRTRSRASTARGSTTSRPSRRRRCSAATRTGAGRSGCRSTTSRSASSSSTSASSATTSRSSTRPARASSARSARSRRTSPTGSSRSGCPGADGRRPLYGGTERLQTDPAWKDNLFFNEYFHGDNGAGLGATHQTGWTALVADLILDPPAGSGT